MKRGEVWLIDFGEPSGPEQSGIRPAVIVQVDDLNAYIVAVVVIPFTTNLKRLELETTILVRAGEAGLDRDSVALCHQVQVRGKSRLKQLLGEVSEELSVQISEKLTDILGLSRYIGLPAAEVNGG